MEKNETNNKPVSEDNIHYQKDRFVAIDIKTDNNFNTDDNAPVKVTTIRLKEELSDRMKDRDLTELTGYMNAVKELYHSLSNTSDPKDIDSLIDRFIQKIKSQYPLRHEVFYIPAHPLMYTAFLLFIGRPFKFPIELLNKNENELTQEERIKIDTFLSSILEQKHQFFDSNRNSLYITTDNPKILAKAKIDHLLFQDDDLRQRSIALAIKRTFGAEGMRHLLGFLIAIDENYNRGYFTFNLNEHLERLGYRKQKRTFSTELKQKASEIVQLMTSLIITTQHKGETKTKKTYVDIETDKLFLIGGYKTRIYEKFGEPIDETLKIVANPAIFYNNPVSSKYKNFKPYTALLKKIARVNHNEHPTVIYLGGLLPLMWRINQKPIKMKIKNLMAWADIKTTNEDRNLNKRLKDLLSELEYMKLHGYLGDWYFKEKGNITIESIIVLPPPQWFNNNISKVSQKQLKHEQQEKQPTDRVTTEDIKYILHKQVLTVAQFGNSIGISYRLANYICNGKRGISKEVEALIKDKYGDILATRQNIEQDTRQNIEQDIE